MRALADGFVRGYCDAAGQGFAGDDADVTAHTGCLMLARTDGKSPAQFLDPPSRETGAGDRDRAAAHARAGLWQWT